MSPNRRIQSDQGWDLLRREEKLFNRAEQESRVYNKVEQEEKFHPLQGTGIQKPQADISVWKIDIVDNIVQRASSINSVPCVHHRTRGANPHTRTRTGSDMKELQCRPVSFMYSKCFSTHSGLRSLILISAHRRLSYANSRGNFEKHTCSLSCRELKDWCHPLVGYVVWPMYQHHLS